MAATGYTKVQDDLLFGTGPVQVAFTWDGTTARARLLDGSGTIVATSTNASTVLNAAVTQVGGTAGGGTVSIFSEAGPIPITSPVVMPSNVQLLGSGALYNQTTAGAVVGNSVLKASGAGMTTANAIIQSIGGSGGPTAQGIQIIGIGLDGNNQTMCWDTINANAPVVSSCVVAHGKPWGLRFRSDIAPNPLPGGGFAAQVWDTTVHGMSSGTGGTGLIQSTGTGATDGRIINCHLRLGTITPQGIDLGGGGWIVEGTHVIGDSATTTSLVNMTGANSMCVGSHLEHAEQGNCLTVGGPKMVVSGNFMVNNTSGGANACIALNSPKGAVSGNVLDTGGTGHGIHSGNSTGSWANYGVIALNHTIGVRGFSDGAGNEVADLDGTGTYIQGNTVTAT